MFRFLFFIIFLFLGVYSLYGFFSGKGEFFNTSSVSDQYDALLSEALQRNTPISQSYEVVFMPQEILRSSGNNNGSSSISSDTKQGENTASNNNSDILHYTHEEIISLGEKISRGGVYIGEEDINVGSFGTPNPNSSIYGLNENCKGLIFDPCIVLERPASTQDQFNLGGTRIYQDPSELSAAYSS